jgi:uncharacterized protein (TIGR00297 family)
MGFRDELPRKSVHIGMGVFGLALRWLHPLVAAASAGVALLFNLFLLHRITGGRLLRTGEQAAQRSFGILVYPAMILGAVLLFHDRLELAAATWALLAVGDGVATLAGIGFGGPRLPWNREKRWSGFLAFALAGGAASAGLIAWTMRDLLAAGAVDRFPYFGPSFVTNAAAGLDVGWWLGASFGVALLVGFVESLDTGVDDNLLVPIFGAALFAAAAAIDPAQVTVSGATIGLLLGTMLWAFGGPGSFAAFFTFFVLGTVCTKVGYKKKAALGIAQERGGRRGPRNAIANMSGGILFAVLAFATPWTTAFLLAALAAFATAASDTVASEIGQAFGRTHLLITNFRRVPAGTDGAVSVEGTTAGIAASFVVAWVGYMLGIQGPMWIPIVAAFVGSTAESYLGVWLESRGTIDNEFINFLNTIVGGGTAFLLARLIGLT